MNTTYKDLITGDLVNTLKASKTKKHRQTCPDCERRLVNLYFMNGIWKCKKCWDKTIGVDVVLQKEG